MRLDFLDRENERLRLAKAFSSAEGTFCCLYGRRRCGKSRLLQESLPKRRSVYFMADEREPNIQRSALAATIARYLPGFDAVRYPDWDSLFARWWREAPMGTVLALDEFPYLVKSSPELPSVLQRWVDENRSRPIHLIIAGSSQRMMMGLVLDANAPLYGRAREIIPVRPLGAGWIGNALQLNREVDLLDAYAFWGGVPRYWELANDSGGGWESIRRLVLDPLGVLHNEPNRLLLDDLKETTQAASILALIGQGCHRISEIGARLGKPATSLARPIQRLIELGLVRREQPFGASHMAGKKTLYRLDDPFLGFWFRYVEPNRSRLESGAVASVLKEIQQDFSLHRGQIWEALVRQSIPLLQIEGKEWMPAHRWWGAGTDKIQLEIDLLSESTDRQWLLIGEVKSAMSAKDQKREEAGLQCKAGKLPLTKSYRGIIHKLFVADRTKQVSQTFIYATDVFRVLK
ncbi:MAG: ATP-binding protein [Desulfatitalea sp.]